MGWNGRKKALFINNLPGCNIRYLRFETLVKGAYFPECFIEAEFLLLIKAKKGRKWEGVKEDEEETEKNKDVEETERQDTEGKTEERGKETIERMTERRGVRLRNRGNTITQGCFPFAGTCDPDCLNHQTPKAPTERRNTSCILQHSFKSDIMAEGCL